MGTPYSEKLRVYHFEHRFHGGLRIPQRRRAEEDARCRSNYFHRMAIWKTWFRGSFIASLDTAMDDAKDLLGHSHPLLNSVASGPERATRQRALVILLRKAKQPRRTPMRDDGLIDGKFPYRKTSARTVSVTP